MSHKSNILLKTLYAQYAYAKICYHSQPFFITVRMVIIIKWVIRFHSRLTRGIGKISELVGFTIPSFQSVPRPHMEIIFAIIHPSIKIEYFHHKYSIFQYTLQVFTKKLRSRKFPIGSGENIFYLGNTQQYPRVR